MTNDVDEALADHIYGLEKTISEDWHWSSKPSGLEESVKVHCIDESYELTMKGWRSPSVPSEFTYSLNYNGGIEIRKWEPNGAHRNPSGEVIRGSLKYKWTGTGNGDQAYKVDDVNRSNADQAFKDFCDECKITFQGDYSTQRGLFNGKL